MGRLRSPFRPHHHHKGSHHLANMARVSTPSTSYRRRRHFPQITLSRAGTKQAYTLAQGKMKRMLSPIRNGSDKVMANRATVDNIYQG